MQFAADIAVIGEIKIGNDYKSKSLLSITLSLQDLLFIPFEAAQTSVNTIIPIEG